jgi:hypothetical protein
LTAPDPYQPLSPELDKLKAYLIGAVLREMEAQPPRPGEHEQTVARWLDEAYVRTQVQLSEATRGWVMRAA